MSRQAWAPLGIAAALTVAGCSVRTPPHTATSRQASASASTRTDTVVTAAKTPWQLRAPVSRLVALRDGDSGILLAGGLSGTGASLTGIYHLNPNSGALDQVGTLALPVHDAAGAALTGCTFFFGGGATNTTGAIQRFSRSGTARIIGQLPQARSDLSAVTLNGRAFLLGGYTGSNQLGSVLETTNGTTFHTVATLAVTVRYAAVAAAGSSIWVFGGEHGTHPVRDIQRIDMTTGTARIVGQMPTPLSDAAALVVNGHILIAGGRTDSGQATRTVYAFDPVRNTAQPIAQLPVPVADAGYVVLHDTGYLLGGENTAPVAVVQTLTVRAIT